MRPDFGWILPPATTGSYLPKWVPTQHWFMPGINKDIFFVL